MVKNMLRYPFEFQIDVELSVVLLRKRKTDGQPYRINLNRTLGVMVHFSVHCNYNISGCLMPIITTLDRFSFTGLKWSNIISNTVSLLLRLVSYGLGPFVNTFAAPLLRQERWKIRRTLLTARPKFKTFVKYWNAWMMNANARITIRGFVCTATATVLAYCADRNHITETEYLIDSYLIFYFFIYGYLTGVETPLTMIGRILSIDSFRAGATTGVMVMRAVLKSGRRSFGVLSASMDGRIGSGSMISTGLAVTSGSGGFWLECFDCSQPLMFRNSVKSTLFLLQQVQPL